MSTSPLFWDYYTLRLLAGESILDVGCGHGHLGDIVATHWRSVNPNTAPPKISGVDAYQANVDYCRSGERYVTVACADAVEFLQSAESKSYDTVLCLEIIEHNDRGWGELLIQEAERVARKRVIFSTPNYPDIRDSVTGIDGQQNQFDAHKSYWLHSDFESQGFHVMGNLYNPEPTKVGKRGRIFTRVLNHFISRDPHFKDLANILAFRHPAHAKFILCWKTLDASVKDNPFQQLW